MGGDGRGSAVGLLRILLVASVGVPLALLALDGWFSYRAAFEDAARDAERTCEVVGEHAAKVFNTQELVARSAADLLGDMNDAEARAAERRLHDALSAMIRPLPQVGSMVMMDADAHLLVATSEYPVSQATDLGDRDYFVALRAASVPTFLSKVQTSRLDGKRFFGLGRRLQTRDGRFRGVVNIAILPRFFVMFWQTLLGPQATADAGTTVALLRDDGTILAIGPATHPTHGTGREVMGPQFLAALGDNAEAGTFDAGDATAPSPATDTAAEATGWRYTYRSVQGYPAYAVVGRSHAAVTRVWLRRMAGHVAVGIPATLALALITWTALQRTRREEAALAQMRAEMQRRETAEAALMQSQRMEAVGQLTGGVAHDFNNLLTIIMGNFEMIGRAAAPGDRTTRLAHAGLAAAQRGADLTAKLLAFSRHRMIRPEVVDVNRLLAEFRPVLRQGVTEAIELSLQLDEAPQPVLLDPGQLEAAVLNLVANARDALPGRGVIRISTSPVSVAHDALTAEAGTAEATLPGGSYVRVAVADDGAGMAASVASRAFEPFFTTKDVGRGTGLGLSQVYGFCRQAGGLARIHSTPGQGTTVELLLPRARQPVGERPPRGRRTPSNAAGLTALVVEDDPAVLEVAVSNLRDLGYATLPAVNATQALDLLRSTSRIDLLFSDVVMPGGMSGVQLSEAARLLRPGLKIVLATGYAGHAADGAMPADIVVLAKPYQRDDLAAALVSV